MKRRNNPLVKLSVWLIINLHQKKISPELNKKGKYCRFYPSCSNYGIIALEKYGFFKGWLKAIVRIIKCKPTNHGSCVDYP